VSAARNRRQPSGRKGRWHGKDRHWLGGVAGSARDRGRSAADGRRASPAAPHGPIRGPDGSVREAQQVYVPRAGDMILYPTTTFSGARCRPGLDRAAFHAGIVSPCRTAGPPLSRPAPTTATTSCWPTCCPLRTHGRTVWVRRCTFRSAGAVAGVDPVRPGADHQELRPVARRAGDHARYGPTTDQLASVRQPAARSGSLVLLGTDQWRPLPSPG